MNTDDILIQKVFGLIVDAVKYEINLQPLKELLTFVPEDKLKEFLEDDRL